MNFFTFISLVVSLQSKQPLFFPGVYMQEEGLNTMSTCELETEVKKESDMSALVVEEILGNSSVESPIKISMVLEESHDISPPKLLDSSSHMLGIQHIISLKQHVESMHHS